MYTFESTVNNAEIPHKNPIKLPRVLFITPHLSTGGCPQYLLKKIQQYKTEMDIFVVEFTFLSDVYTVQRDAILSIIPPDHFYSLGSTKSALLYIIDEINPDIIHFEELSESMAEFSLLRKIYLKEDRRYFITENTHSSHSNPDSKIFLPDKFIFACEYSKNVYSKLNVPSTVWEYPIEYKKRPNREEALTKLGLDPSKKHVLNIGLFTPGKNQAAIFDIANSFSDTQFHFVGNQAGNFEHYWKPLMEHKPDNCIIWGERSDTDVFLLACDVFYFPSLLELNPLVIKEALGAQIPIMMRNLDVYLNKYDNEKMIHFIEGNDEQLLSKLLAIKEKRTKIVHILSDISSEIEQKSIASVSTLADKNIEYTIHLNPVTTSFNLEKEPMWITDSLNPGHYGCFEAFRKAIVEDFTNDYDYLIVCERDCILEKDSTELKTLLSKTYDAMSKHDVHFFSFGDKVDLSECYLQSNVIENIEDFAYVTDKIIGLQFVIFDKQGVDFLKEAFIHEKWQAMDLWFGVIFEKYGKKQGILNERVTTQMNGYSLIDKSEKIFKANDRNV